MKVGFDRVIDNLRDAFELKLTYIETYPAVKRGGADHLKGNYPQVYKNDGTGESVRLMPDNSKKAILFFEKVKHENNLQTGENTYEMNLIFWFNLFAIDNLKTYDFTEEIIEDILVVLRSFNIVSGININHDYRFENYNFVDVTGKQMTTYPFSCIKISSLKILDC